MYLNLGLLSLYGTLHEISKSHKMLFYCTLVANLKAQKCETGN